MSSSWNVISTDVLKGGFFFIFAFHRRRLYFLQYGTENEERDIPGIESYRQRVNHADTDSACRMRWMGNSWEIEMWVSEREREREREY